MPIDSSAFVKPAVAESRVHTNRDAVLLAIKKKIGQIKTERRVAIVVAPDEIAVAENQRAAKRAIEIQEEPAAQFALGHIKHSAVPAHAGLGITPAQRFVPMRLQFFVVDEGQLNGPIVWKVQSAPACVVELCQREFELAGLGKVSLRLSETEIASRIATVALEEPPIEVKKKFLSRGEADRRRGVNGFSPRGRGVVKYGLGEGETWLEKDAAGGESQTRTKQVAAIAFRHGRDPPRPCAIFHTRRCARSACYLFLLSHFQARFGAMQRIERPLHVHA